MRSIHVVAGILLRPDDHILLSKRPEAADLGGYWELPGGKMKVGESRCQALTRELLEELGAEVERARPFHLHTHDYPKQQVTLDVWMVEAWRGETSGREHQLIEWVPLAALRERLLPPANEPVINKLLLSPR